MEAPAFEYDRLTDFRKVYAEPSSTVWSGVEARSGSSVLGGLLLTVAGRTGDLGR